MIVTCEREKSGIMGQWGEGTMGISPESIGQLAYPLLRMSDQFQFFGAGERF
ncbi:hypothetical protein HY947_02495 [Candidatus Gottesmanbacteria bacterium]|nr:hypothetical protein [Candidatus Gottesmanbacteria bacterium]